MTAFVALYAGTTIASARLVAVSADADIVGVVSARLLDQELPADDLVVEDLGQGRRAALRRVQREAVANASH